MYSNVKIIICKKLQSHNNMDSKFMQIFTFEIFFDIEKISRKYKVVYFRIRKKLFDQRLSYN